jgi:hypothetical protein
MDPAHKTLIFHSLLTHTTIYVLYILNRGSCEPEEEGVRMCKM